MEAGGGLAHTSGERAAVGERRRHVAWTDGAVRAVRRSQPVEKASRRLQSAVPSCGRAELSSVLSKVLFAATCYPAGRQWLHAAFRAARARFGTKGDTVILPRRAREGLRRWQAMLEGGDEVTGLRWRAVASDRGRGAYNNESRFSKPCPLCRGCGSWLRREKASPTFWAAGIAEIVWIPVTTISDTRKALRPCSRLEISASPKRRHPLARRHCSRAR